MAVKQKILIVDDDANIAELISLYLLKECYDTKIVEDGESALHEFKTYQPNLILLDLMLPGIDGYQVCREIRTQSNVPIIMLSAKGEVFDKVLGLELGADDYIIKPFDSKELVARVKAVLRRYQAVKPEKEEPDIKCVEYPDLVINNAGISYIGLLQDMAPEEWDRIVRTNLTSVFNCSKLAIPHMLEQKSGKILNISSVWGNVGASCEVAYSATKGGINSFTRALAKELAPSNVQVNAVACGAIDTDMNHFLEKEELEALKEEIPAGRLAKPEEVAQLLLQLARSDSYLTGQIIGFDGGWI